MTTGSRSSSYLAWSREQCCWRIVAMMPTGSEPLFVSMVPGRISRRKEIGQRRYASAHIFTGLALVERFFNKIKHCRRVATRYDKLAANYLAFVQLASIRLWLRVNESAS